MEMRNASPNDRVEPADPLVYRLEHTLLSSDVDLHQRLRTSRLLEMLQEASIAHTEALGAGRAVTLDQGILWVVALQRIHIARMPRYDERIVLESWPGETMHVLFPRHYLLSSATGEELVRASALWMLLDRQTRRMSFPERVGVCVPGTSRMGELPLPDKVAEKSCDRYANYTVPFSVCDLNGHMNNTRYLDLVEDLGSFARRGLTPHLIQCEYAAEARLEDRLRIGWREDESGAYFCGEREHPCFRIALSF